MTGLARRAGKRNWESDWSLLLIAFDQRTIKATLDKSFRVLWHPSPYVIIETNSSESFDKWRNLGHPKTKLLSLSPQELREYNPFGEVQSWNNEKSSKYGFKASSWRERTPKFTELELDWNLKGGTGAQGTGYRVRAGTGHPQEPRKGLSYREMAMPRHTWSGRAGSHPNNMCF